jgi:hypothetical protein
MGRDWLTKIRPTINMKIYPRLSRSPNQRVNKGPDPIFNQTVIPPFSS